MSDGSSKRPTSAALSPEKQQLLLQQLRQKGARNKVVAERPKIERRPRTGEALALSFAQQRLWILDQLEPGNPTYNIPTAIRLKGKLDVAALERSFQEILRRHESLRTTFQSDEGKPRQVISPELKLTLARVDLRHLPEASREEEALRRANEETQRPFDLASDPLVRASLLQLAEQEHVLVVTMHHIVSDGWSKSVLVREVGALYLAYATGGESPLPELPLQYADYAAWQRDFLQGDVLEKQLAWWRKQLEGAQALELPTDHPRPAIQSYRGARLSFALPQGLSERLKALGKGEQATDFMVLLAAFQALLHRYTGQEDLSVGSPIAGRTHAELEPLIGFFVNTLVLRTRLSPGMTFRELLARVKESTLGAYAHQDVSFEKLVDELHPQRDPSRSPLFQVLFTLQNVPTSEVAFPDLSLQVLELENRTAKFDLTLALMPGEQGFAGTLEYNVDLFDEATAARMVEHLRNLLEGVAANPDARLSALPLLGEAERRRLLVEWNDTNVPLRPACLHEHIEAQAARTPDAVAVVAEDGRLTYAELDRKANQLARHLRLLGVGPDVLVGLFIERSADMVVGLLGILKAGGAYVPLDPGYPRERLSWMLQDTRPAVLLTHERLRERLPEGQRVLCLDSGWAEVARQPAEAVAPLASPENLAYVIFTSGSTGRPKGAMNEHRAICNRLVWMQGTYGLGTQDVLLQKTPFSFDVSVWEFFWPLMTGARLVMARPGGHQEPAYLTQLVREQGVTTLHFVPSMLQVFLEEPEAQACTSIKRVVCSGEALPLDLKERCLQRLPWVELLNLYGPTEAAVEVTFHACQAQDGRRSVPIGKPVANTQIRILDAALQPAPIGVPGELYIGGVQVCRGYLARPDLTADRFIPDPFSGTPGARLYRTGDVARWRPDGNIEYLGRADFQVKIRGFRIELGEIEAALTRHPSVREAAVIVHKDRGGHSRLVAYVVGQGAAPDAAALRASLQASLPEYMVPSTFMALDALPLSSHGKVDRKALPAPESAPADREKTYVAPRNATEQTLAEIWAKLLGLDQVGVEHNFFDLGGDSILAIQLVARARQAGLHLNVRQIFRHQTIAELAPLATTAAPLLVSQEAVQGEAPLTPIQRWFFGQRLPEPHHFNQALHFEVHQALDPARLERALAKLVEHHDALRLSFTRSSPTHSSLTHSSLTHSNDSWRQHHAEAGAPSLIQRDLSSLPAAEQPAALQAEATRIQRSFDLAQPPLVRAALIHLGAGKPDRLLLVLHHLVVDGVSWRVLLEDLQTAYLQLSEGKPLALPPKTTSFKAWAEKLVAYAQSPALEAELPLWLAEPRPAPAPLPIDLPGGDNTAASSRAVSVRLTAEETQALLQEAPAAYRAQINDLLLTALAQALSRWTGGSSFRVDLEGHGREDLFEDVDLSRTVGWFTSVAPVLLEVPAGATPGESLRAVRDALRRIPAHGIGHGLLRHLGRPEVREKLQALSPAQVGFNYLGQLDAALADSPLLRAAPDAAGVTHSPLGERPHLFEVNAYVSGGCLAVTIGYSHGLHREATASALAEGFLSALRTLLAQRRSPDALRYTPADFPLARIPRDVLERLLPPGSPVEDLYPLSPMQQGMLFHSLRSSAGGFYVEQLSLTLDAGVDLAVLRRAWEALVAQNPILRTSFHWKNLEDPLQWVHPDAPLPWVELDWRDCPPAERQTRLAALLEELQSRGFELERAPLMRLTLIRMDDRSNQLVWTHHHILIDGWARGVLVQQLVAAYQALRAGQPPPPRRGPAFRDYIAWLQQQDMSRAEAWWRAALDGFTAPTPVPDPAPPSSHAEPSYDKCSVTLPAATVAALRGFAQQHQLTVNTLTQGAWALLLNRFSGQEDVLFGSTTSGRPPELPGVEAMVGLFINTLPVRVQVSPDQPLLPWLQKLQSWLLDQRQYEFAPLFKVQGWSQVPRGSPLFETIYLFENFPVDPTRPPEGNPVVRDLQSVTRAHYPLGFVVGVSQGLTLTLRYERSRMDGALVERMLGNLRTMLEGFVARPEQRLGEIPLLSAQERQQLLVEWNAGRVDAPPACVHHLFEAQVAQRPDAVAAAFQGATLTYRELDRRANQLAWHLRSFGIRPDVRVGLYLERSLDVVVGMLGILKAGGAFVPLDPQLPAERLAFMVQDAQLPLVLTQDSLADNLPASSQIFCLDSERARLDGLPPEAPPSGVLPDNLAYVIYTSGSTGRPKGTLLTHRGLCNTAPAVARGHGFHPDSRVLQFASLSFDASVAEIFSTLVSGGSLHLASPEELVPGRPLRELMEREAITAVTLTPSVLAQLDPEGMPALRTVVSVGEACPPELARRWGQGRTLLNGYGPTEATICATLTRGPVDPDRLTIGRPLPNMRVYVLDEAMRPLPVGAPGELYVAGPGLARGLFGRPDLTADRFVPDPFSAVPGERMYRTGDRVRFLPEGELQYLGRGDLQVKVRGFRIELGEIEAALAAHRAVREAVVLAREDVPGDKRLVAYVVARPGEALEPADLRQELSQTLPHYMVPSAFVMMEALPLTPSGKVDRKALKAPAEEQPAPEEGFLAPRTPTEELLADIWAQVLNLKRVGVESHFFELGGHSLLATQVISRIQSAFQVELSLGELFEAPTLGAQATRIDAAVLAGHDLPVPPLRPQPRPEAPPLSFAQQRLWFLAQLEPNSPFYNAPTALRLEGALDVRVLERCFTEVVRRHEALRTAFRATESGPVQVIQPARDFPLRTVDLRGLPDAAREQEARRLVDEEVRQPFDLSRDIPLRGALLQLAEQEYVLLVVMHHIASDGWSSGLLVREVAALYEAFSRGEPSPLPELPLQYADYAIWQRGWLQGEALGRQLSFWRRQLEGAPQLLELPTDRPRPAVRSHRGAFLNSRLPKELSEQLKALGRREGATVFMTLLAAFQALLSRYTGQQEVLVGTDIANRNHAGTEELIGFFINQLVMRGDLSGAPTFQQLLAQVRRTALAAYAHQDLPFEELVRELNPERSMAHAPLFQVKLVLQNMPFTALEFSQLTLRSFGADPGTTKLDLQLTAADTPEGLAFNWRYSTDLFDAATVSRLAEHFQRLIEGIVGAPAAALADLPLISEQERRQLLVDWNDTRAEYAPACIHHLFEAQAARRPDAVAVAHEGSQLTYGELNRKANQLAHHLRRLGVRAETRVGLFVERSLDAIVGMLGILKAGGAYVPLDPAFAQVSDRLAFMLQDASASLVVTQDSLADELPSSSGQFLVCLDSDWDQIAVQPDTNPQTEISPENLVYIIYTSGSTGMPKGVSIEHRQLSNYLQGVSRRLELSEDVRFASISTLAADLGNTAIFPALCRGGALHLISRERSTDAEALASLMAKHPVGGLKIVPSHLRALLASPNAPALLPRERLVLGGEASDWALIDQVRAAAPDCLVFNHYGPTETTVGVFTHPVPRDGAAQASATVPIGRPIPNATAYILDARLQPVPRGVPGELFIGGLAVGRGYLRRPDLTAERFLPDPFSSAPGGRLYRTGDRVRMLPSGAVEFLGRVDFQLKLRGFRIELGEIEASLKQHPAVDTAVVLAREDSPGHPRLVAYLVPQEARPVDAAELRSFLKTKLPDYMVPSAFVLLKALPITPNGKLDRKALPPPDDLREADAFVAPRTPAEELLAGIWAQVLNVERVGVQDDFFDLGGHSLIATQVISRIRSAFQVELPLGELFEAPTLGALAARIEAAVQAGQSLPIPPLAPQPRSETSPLSFAQQRLWFLAQLEPNNPFYNSPTALRMSGELDVALLARCFTEVLRRHEALRTTFRSTEQGPVQVVQPARAFPLQEVDLRALPEREREQEARRRVNEAMRQPFDLAADLPCRALLVRLADEEHVLLVVMHHIASDGWSSGVLVREVAALYGAFSQGQPSPLPELPLQYADYALWQRAWLQGEALDRQLSFWRRELEGAPLVLELPADRPRPAVRGYQGAVLQSRLPKELSEKMKALGRQEGATLFMVLMAAFQSLLSRYTGQQDLLVGTDIANRNHAGTEELIGFFINQLVMRADLSEDPTFQQLLAQVRRRALAAYAHQDLPFEELVRELNPERSMAHAPLFQVKLVLQNMPGGELELSRLTLRPFGADPGTTKLDLQLMVVDTGDGLTLHWRYSADLFGAPTVSRMAEHFQRLLEAAVSAPSTRLGELPLLSADERHQLLVDWNATRAEQVPACVHHLFEAQAARSPDAVAVAYEDSQLTYGELNRKANQLAHHLRRLGVRAETRVGLFVERSLDAIVGMLGILKAGGAYVPLDPAFAQVSDRLAFMLQDASASVVVTQDALADELPASSSQLLVCLDSDWDQIAVQPDTSPQTEVSPENLVYIIYTSGSTGMPKGVSIEHRQLSHYVQGVARRLELPAGARLASISTLAADLGNTSIFPALCLGGALHLLSREQATDTQALAAHLTRHPVDVLKIVPSHLRALLAAPDPKALLPRQRLVLGGEASDWALIEQVRALAPDCAVFNHYGPTETTVGALTHPAAPERNPERHSLTLPIGQPIPNATAYILDAHLQPVPRGVPGELFIGGLSVGRGYLRRPDLTAERFLPDPFSSAPGGRLYRTGDRVRMLPSGAVEFLGRVDFQLKLRGFRIELGEIEASLKQHPAVDTAVVLAREDSPGHPRLVAYLVPHAGDVDAGELRGFLKTKLPDYMIPSAFVALPALPITPNGKLDRKALPPPDDLRQEADAYVAPRDLLEITLAGIFEDLLNVRPVSVHGNFFELGGHSLLAVQLVIRIREATGQSVSVASLFESPTVEKLAALLRQETGPWTPLVPLQRAGSRRPFFCVHPVGGTSFCYADLARALGPDQPFYGLQAPGIDGEQPPLETVEALAQLYVKAIKSVQPEGPYQLGGWSFGGKVAFEMAQLLEAQGEEVALLALFDTHAQLEMEGPPGGDLRDFNVHFVRALEAKLGQQLGFSDEQLRSMEDEELLQHLLVAARKANIVLPNAGLAQLRGVRDVNRQNLRASVTYVPRPCETPVTLFAAKETRASVPPDRHWGAVARGGLEIHEVPGTHQRLMNKPFVDAVAAALTRCLERLDDPAPARQKKLG